MNPRFRRFGLFISDSLRREKNVLQMIADAQVLSNESNSHTIPGNRRGCCSLNDYSIPLQSVTTKFQRNSLVFTDGHAIFTAAKLGEQDLVNVFTNEFDLAITKQNVCTANVA